MLLIVVRSSVLYYKRVRVKFSGVGYDDFFDFSLFVGFFSNFRNGSDTFFVSNTSHKSLTESDAETFYNKSGSKLLAG